MVRRVSLLLEGLDDLLWLSELLQALSVPGDFAGDAGITIFSEEGTMPDEPFKKYSVLAIFAGGLLALPFTRDVPVKNWVGHVTWVFVLG